MTRARRIAAEAAGTAFLAQLAGAFAGVAAATVLFRWLARSPEGGRGGRDISSRRTEGNT